jgi:electron transport complex protein RnfC
VGLDPEELYKQAGGLSRGSSPGRAGECHGCGCCEVVCPSRLPLAGVILGSARGAK